MRDRLAHHYFDTSRAILQHTIDHDISTLKGSVATLQERVNDFKD